MSSVAELEQTPEAVKALAHGTRVADCAGDLWGKQGGTDSWKMEGTTGTRTTSARLLDLWGPLTLVPPAGLSGGPLLSDR